MSANETNPTTSIGLDIGSSRIVIARQTEQGFAYESQLNAFVAIPHSRMTESALSREQIPHIVEDGAIFVHGNESERFADLLQVDLRRPVMRGVLNASEPDSVKMIRQIVGSLLAEAEGQKLCFTVPAAPFAADSDLTYHEATMRQIFEELGYQVSCINEGLAVVYSELADTNYTGIGVSFGGGVCNVCFSYLSLPVLSFSVTKAGDFVDASAASVSGELAGRVRMLKEQSFVLNGHAGNKLDQALGVYYDEMIRAVVGAMKEVFAANKRARRVIRPIPLVLSGGSTLPLGFRDRFEKILRENELAVPMSEVRLAADPLTSTARGALVTVLSEN
ncbi:MAG: hypothetical protein U0Q18_03785 [Bryobacteraceae bacterium]